MSSHRAAAEVAAVVFAFFVFAIGLVMVMSAGAAAQDGGNANVTQAQQPAGEYIDQNTQLIAADLDRDTDEVTVQLQSRTVQSVRLFDPAGYWTEGEPASRSVRMYPDQRVNVTLPLEELQGNYAVVIDTDETVHPIRLREPTQDLGFLTVLKTTEGIAAGALAAFSWFVISGVYVLWIEGGEPEVA
jgi:hypothetical protein